MPYMPCLHEIPYIPNRPYIAYSLCITCALYGHCLTCIQYTHYKQAHIETLHTCMHVHTLMCAKQVVINPDALLDTRALLANMSPICSRTARWPRHCSRICLISTKCQNRQDSASTGGNAFKQGTS